MTAQPRLPANLIVDGAGAELWHGVTAGFELRAYELVVLAAACMEADLIEQLRDGMVDQPLIARGSMGQPVVNPLIPELRQHRATLAALLRALKLTDDDEKAAAGSAAGRQLALARWRKGPK